MINFIYEINQNKYLIGNYQNKKLKNKMFYYQSLDKLDFAYPVKFFLKDTKFNFYYKSFAFNQENKFSIAQLESLLKEFKQPKEQIIWYIINNININWEPEKYLLGQKWEISFWLGVYSLHTKYLDQIKKIFWQNPVHIFPTSLASIQCISKIFENWNILYLLENTTKTIQIINWFYHKVEEISLWLKELHNWILETFHQDISWEQLNEFQQKVYKKKLEEFIQPLVFFIKDNSINKNLYLIWNLAKYPLLTETLSKHLKIPVIPLRIDNKTFQTIDQLDLFCIQKINV